MDSLFDFIIPVLVFVFWIVGQFLNSRGNKEEDSPPIPTRNQQDDSAPDRTRDIQEEIRRKIAERRQQQAQPQGQMPPPVPAQRQARPPEPEPVAEDPFARQPWNRDNEPQTPPPMPANHAEPDRLTVELKRRREELAAAKKQANQARKETQKQIAKSTKVKTVRQRGPRIKSPKVAAVDARRSLREDVLTDLKTTNAIRRAFVLKELLDKPVGLRSHRAPFQ